MFLHGQTLEEVEKSLEEAGEKAFRAKQILEWVYLKGIADPFLMTNLSHPLRQKIAELFSFQSLKEIRRLDSSDGETTKFLWAMGDQEKVESVLIRAPGRRTVCVSSQVGCAAKCAFCASGKQGWLRNLSVAEIVEQVYRIDRMLQENGERVSHIVFMGMGEPFENYDAVLKAIRLLMDVNRFHISHRRITVSTVGIVDKIRRFSEEDVHVNLVLSLHAPNQRIRQKIIPYARKYPIEDLIAAMIEYAKKTKRDITYEYTLIAGINDAEEHAKELALLLAGQQCTVNLIPYNPVEGLRIRRPCKENIQNFRAILEEAKIPTTWRYTKGKDIAAACGQLALQKNI